MGENWPRLMNNEQAAAYCGLSVGSFRTAVAPYCRKLNPVSGRVAWLRDDLDCWINKLAGVESVKDIQQEKKLNPLDMLT